MACVADDIGADRWDLRDAIVDNVKNSNSKVVKACREQWPALSAGGAAVVAVLDDDHARACVSLPSDACKPQVREHVWRGKGLAGDFVLVLLQRNTEDLIEVAARVLGRPVARPIPKSIVVRDSGLNAAAAHPDRSVRDRIRTDVPSFDRLVCKLGDAWRARSALDARD